MEARKIMDCLLYNSFTFVKGIGLKTETTLKELGINSWNDVIKNQYLNCFQNENGMPYGTVSIQP